MLLVAVDIEGCAWVVVDEAARLARDLGTEVRLMTSVCLPSGVSPHAAMHGVGEGKTPLELLREDAAQGLEALTAPFRDAGCAVQVEVRVGPPADAIVEAAKELKPRMLVMGSHGRTGIARLVLGSVAERVLRQASCPVVVIPGHGTVDHHTAAADAVRAEADG